MRNLFLISFLFLSSSTIASPAIDKKDFVTSISRSYTNGKSKRDLNGYFGNTACEPLCQNYITLALESNCIAYAGHYQDYMKCICSESDDYWRSFYECTHCTPPLNAAEILNDKAVMCSASNIEEIGFDVLPDDSSQEKWKDACENSYSFAESQCGPYDISYFHDDDVFDSYFHCLCNLDNDYWLSFYKCASFEYKPENLEIYKEEDYECSKYKTKVHNSVDLKSFWSVCSTAFSKLDPDSCDYKTVGSNSQKSVVSSTLTSFVVKETMNIKKLEASVSSDIVSVSSNIGVSNNEIKSFSTFIISFLSLTIISML
ncbi:uncharacterized protein ASCRUDRAFT_76690 [Ascoidea rubescens DSM 1968]|uniref:WSC domain-containing protein n=1 Tax=Ascoidea rubescens DSM 1968 TaxID=1344418 RepID=A0A1D2VEZ7_9ASCO|nr:hypothetical protein ASCRUDRAFT_76690 [Ascoidea rubescens DSM 1968]ODV60195.1 hypothetical protein ASCRUDRAFT_76690 [Ascoidea rubescens DSM 1968]